MIIHVKDRQPFAIIAKRGLQDNRLSYKARGILAYLMTKPDKWEVRIQDLVNQSSKDGQDAVYSGIKELREHKYMTLITVRENGRIKERHYNVSDVPEDEAKGNPLGIPELDRDFPDQEKT